MAFFSIRSSRNMILLIMGFFCIFLGSLIYQTIPWFDKYFGRVTIEAILFHIDVGNIAAADSSVVISYLKRILTSFLISISLVCISIFLQKRFF